VWSADGDEVVASYGSSDRGGFITAFALDGAQRPLVRTVSGLRLMDIAANGGLLLTSDVYPVAIQGVLATGSTALGPGRLTGVTIDGISDNGEIVVGSTTGSLVNGGYRAFYRRSDGAEIDIGEGTGIGVSPDGQWAFLATRSRDIHQIRAAPTGPGEMRTFDLGDVRPLVHDSRDRISFTSDGNRAAIRGQRPGEEPRGFLLELESPGSLREVSPPGFRDIRISPDGRLLVGTEVDGTLVVYTIEGGVRTRVQGALDGELPVAWSSTSDAVFVWDRRIPARVQRIDLLTGERSLALEWTPEGSAEGLYGLLTVSVDARYFLMRFRAGQSSLAVARQAE
ncbi:MAG: hypothetical protein K8J08_04085, partial [Thermoanaerobaculia bacterium]|nr:hypothetical protein [Thermoanaerobaculia bacterium]